MGTTATSRPRRHSLRDRLILLAVLVAIGSGLGFAYLNRNVHRVSLAPGQATELVVNLDMQRPWRSKSFAKTFELPVRCLILDARRNDRINVRVLETGHGLHRMWAKLEISASPSASPGRRTLQLDFSIDGEGDWPRPVLHVEVR